MKGFKILTGIALAFFIQNVQAQTSFLGFGQQQCASKRDYSVELVTCSSHSYAYNIYKENHLIYSVGCPTGFFRGSSASSLLFVNDSVGFMIESYVGDNMTAYKRIMRTTDSGKSWVVFAQPDMHNGPTGFCAFYVLNENNGIFVTATYENGPKPGYVQINDIHDKIDRDTTYNYPVKGSSICGIDTLSFKLNRGSDTIAYKIRLNFSIPTPILIPEDSATGYVYPNPVSDYFTIDHYDLNANDEVFIYDSQGRLMKTFTNSESDIFDIRDLGCGLYYVKLSNGKSTVTAKFIKK